MERLHYKHYANWLLKPQMNVKISIIIVLLMIGIITTEKKIIVNSDFL